MPQRIQRRRTKGWRLPPNTICVTRPGRFGNPFRIGDYAKVGGRLGGPGAIGGLQWLYCTAIKPSPGFVLIENKEQAVEWFRRLATVTRWADKLREELRGKDLACWCGLDELCHADVWLEIANQ